LPPYAADFEELLHLFLLQAHVDGVFTDFPDRAVRYREKVAAEKAG
jgi:glycerophosphoryl diester phosphodiesterase